MPVHCMRMRPMPRLSASTPMYDMLKLFQTGRSHMAVLTQPGEDGGACRVHGEKRGLSIDWMHGLRGRVLLALP